MTPGDRYDRTQSDMENGADKIVSESSYPSPLSRRSFLSWMGLGWSMFSASMVLGFAATIRFFFPNINIEKRKIIYAGKIDDFTFNMVDERFKEKHGFWLVRLHGELFSLSSVCTHLGCTPNWFKDEQKFKCPCHGSVFTAGGENISGPAPRALERYRVSLGSRGQVFIDKNRVFREEKGEWTLPDSKIVF